jgi:hypothetical protein
VQNLQPPRRNLLCSFRLASGESPERESPVVKNRQEWTMLKRIGIILLVAASAVVGPSAAYAQQQLYITHCYSDASHTTEVGEIVPYCHADGSIYYRLFGTYTTYQEDEPVDNGVGCFVG